MLRVSKHKQYLAKIALLVVKGKNIAKILSKLQKTGRFSYDNKKNTIFGISMRTIL